MEIFSHLLRCDRHFSAGVSTKSVVWVEENMGEEEWGPRRETVFQGSLLHKEQRLGARQRHTARQRFWVVLL